MPRPRGITNGAGKDEPSKLSGNLTVLASSAEEAVAAAASLRTASRRSQEDAT